MCTLSILPINKNQVIFTFNRDESPNRESTPPQLIEDEGESYLSPIDLESYGTWLGVSETGILIFLMNGGFVKHKRKESYKHSRGLIIPMFYANQGSIAYLDEMDLIDIEPFTLLIYKDNALTHFVWDGRLKFWNNLKNSDAHIFSSSTLYTQENKITRQTWFESAIEKFDSDHATKILNLHLTSYLQNGLRYPGGNKVETVSTSQIIVTEAGARFDYYDLSTNKKWTNQLTWKKITH